MGLDHDRAGRHDGVLAVFTACCPRDHGGGPGDHRNISAEDDTHVSENTALRSGEAQRPIWAPQRMQAVSITFTSVSVQYQFLRDFTEWLSLMINLILHGIRRYCSGRLLRKLRSPRGMVGRRAVCGTSGSGRHDRLDRSAKSVAVAAFYLGELLLYFRYCGIA